MSWNLCRNRCGQLSRYRTGGTCRGCQKRDWYRKNRGRALAYNALYYTKRAR